MQSPPEAKPRLIGNNPTRIVVDDPKVSLVSGLRGSLAGALARVVAAMDPPSNKSLADTISITRRLARAGTALAKNPHRLITADGFGYRPHNGSREMARRRRQMERAAR